MSRQFTEQDAIRNLQTYLRAQVLVDSSFPRVPLDGIYDTATRNAVRVFQEKNSLTPTGMVDRATWDALYEQYLDIIAASALPSPIIPFPSYPKDYSIKSGEQSFLVSIVQYMINEIVLVYDFLPALSIDGVYGPITEEAVREIQIRNGLSPTGEVDRATWESLARIFNFSTHYLEQN